MDDVTRLDDRAGKRRHQETERADLWAWLRDDPMVRAQPALTDWAASCRAAGLIGGSLERTRSLLTDALTVLAALTAQAEPLPAFAARILKGDSHALDDGTRLSTIVLRAVALNPHGPQPGRLTEAPWDPELAKAMTEHERAVVEELVADVLLEELARATCQEPGTGRC
ncbi:TIGR02679 domain-containing protein [Streptomyces sp. NPDC003710]